jgi:hypothetical protein
MKRINVFEASHNSDSAEGRGRSVHDGYFVHKKDADRAAKGKGCMGTAGDVDDVELIIFDTYEEFKGEKDNQLRTQALNKLSAEEREALGYGAKVIEVKVYGS